MNLKQLNENVYIADQLSIDDVSELKALGIKTIVNNRPDHEEESQPISADIAEQAVKNNIDYYDLPIISGMYPVKSVEKLTELLNQLKYPVVIFCRTGNRSVNLWALSQLNKFGYQYVFRKAKSIGYDIHSIL